MFCPKCGKENPDTNQFCGGCGEGLIKIPSNKTQKKTVYKPIIILILFGILIILAMYLLPVVPCQSTIYGACKTTLAKTSEICGSGMPGTQSCNELISWTFFIGWGIGIILIVMGICNKKKIV